MAGARTDLMAASSSQLQSPAIPMFEDILYTNAILSDAECLSIRKLVVAPRKEVEDLTKETVCMQALLDQLVEKQNYLNEFIDAHLALLSPARRLPDDIVREIFIALLPANRNATMNTLESPVPSLPRIEGSRFYHPSAMDISPHCFTAQ
ncbi:hypothetical protein C8R44DRAFT_865587 [Mycena epipterygia]|nr:hypothetical protein C8R44DRAFT_865587 [Mycena epipterygia]